MFKQQQTLKKSVSFSGIGLHTGNSVTMTLKPAPLDGGIRFRRLDLEDQPEVEALVANVVDTTRGTTVAKGNVRVHTIEHVMAAFHALGIDNALVELDSNELPVGDGSALPYVKMIREAGVVVQDGQKEIAQVTEPVWLSNGGSLAVVLPAERLQVSCTIAFATDGLESQFCNIDIDRETFEEQIAPCRTFCFYHELEQLMKAGLIKGGSLENAIIIRGEAVFTQGRLRFPDEFVRHKILDVVGDVYLLGRPLAAHIVTIRPGHTLNYEVTKQLSRMITQRPTQPSVSPPSVIGNLAELDIHALFKMLPHRYPFMLVDRVLKIDGNNIRALKNVTINEPYFQGHFPGHPVMPGVLQVEAMAQVAGILMLRVGDNAGKLAYFMSADKVKFRKPVIPGDQVVIEAELTKARKNIGRAKCVCKVGDEIVSEAELMFLVHD